MSNKPDEHTYEKVTEGNTKPWTYEKAVEVDKEEAEETSAEKVKD